MAIDPSTLYGGASTPSGTDFLTQYGNFVGDLVETAVLRLTSVAGTDTITASAEPFSVPSTGLVTGMKFTLVPANNNTGAATLNIDARGAESIVSGDGSTLNADELVDGTRYLLEYDGTNFVIIGSQGGAGAAAASVTTYDTTAVWTNGLPANTLVQVELWGAGGGGNGSTGGSGASYDRRLFKAGDLPGSVTITIPSGAAINTLGGNATFGSLMTAYGGAAAGGTPGRIHGPSTQLENLAVSWSGSTGVAAGAAFGTQYGGAGGGAAAGQSLLGGNGGASGAAGQRPGGGGGINAVGGAGRCIITVLGG